jgi:hypothetical protein
MDFLSCEFYKNVFFFSPVRLIFKTWIHSLGCVCISVLSVRGHPLMTHFESGLLFLYGVVSILITSRKRINLTKSKRSAHVFTTQQKASFLSLFSLNALCCMRDERVLCLAFNLSWFETAFLFLVEVDSVTHFSRSDLDAYNDIVQGKKESERVSDRTTKRMAKVLVNNNDESWC